MQDFRMETFLEVCECMNYTQAAQRLNLTQPAVSQHIHYLEKMYEVKLFEQRGKRICLTEAGELLRRTALTIKHDEIHLKMRMKGVQDQARSYDFGATLTVAEYMLAPELERFIGRTPGSRLRMCVENTKMLLRLIDEGTLDFAIVEGEFPRRDYDFFLYRTESYVAAASCQRAASLAGKAVEDLLDETLILREEGSGTREIFERYLAGRGVEISDFARVLELGNIGSIKEMVRRGLGITFLYEAALKGEEGIEVFPLRQFDISHDIAFVFRKNSRFREDYVDIYQKFTSI